MIVQEINYIEPKELLVRLYEERYLSFLDSQDTTTGRYSYLGYDPYLVFTAKDGEIELIEEGKSKVVKDNPFEVLRKIILDNVYQQNTLVPWRMSGGAIGFFSYNATMYTQPIHFRSIDDVNVSDIMWCFYDFIVVLDNFERKCYLCARGLPGDTPHLQKLHAKERIEKFISKLNKTTDYQLKEEKKVLEQIESNFSCSQYINAVNKALYYIKEGDIYQVNLSQRFKGELTGSPLELYLHLRKAHPAPYAAYLNFGDLVVLCSSPERFIFIDGDYIKTCPIKGTRPRKPDKKQDLLQAKALKNSQKDKAELVMIVDLLRNDLGKVCKYTTVKVEKMRQLERHPTVWHTVATISGQLKSDTDIIDVMYALFPGGSVTGCPKLRAIQIIDELEPHRRTLYCGSLGYISYEGKVDLNIIIRTIYVKKNFLYFHGGGAIVADSDPESEYQETIDKVSGLLNAFYSLDRKNSKVLAV